MREGACVVHEVSRGRALAGGLGQIQVALLLLLIALQEKSFTDGSQKRCEDRAFA